MAARKHPNALRFKIKGTAGNSRLSARDVARVLNGLQDIFFLVGDEILGNKPRASGTYPAKVREEFALRVKEIRTGSVEVTFALSDHHQADLHGGVPVVDRAMATAGDFFSAVTAEAPTAESLERVFREPIRRSRALREVESMLPSDGTYVVEGKLGGRSLLLDRRALTNARSLLAVSSVPADRVVVGRVATLTVDRKREFVVDPVDGKPIRVKYPRELEDALRDVFGRLAALRLRRAGKGAFVIDNEEAVTRLRAIPLTELRLPDGWVTVSPPLDFEFQVDESDQYLASHDELGIVAAARDMASLVRDIQDQFEELWRAYVDCPEEQLTAGGKDLRAALLRKAGR